MTDHELALEWLNQFKYDLARAVRTGVRAAEDGRIDWREGIKLGTQGLRLGLEVANLLEGLEHGFGKELLYVLEHGQWEMKDGLGSDSSRGGT